MRGIGNEYNSGDDLDSATFEGKQRDKQKSEFRVRLQ